MESLIQAMSWTSAALQIPVIIAILYLLARGLIGLGAIYSQWSERQRLARRIQAAASQQQDTPHAPDASDTPPDAACANLQATAHDHAGNHRAGRRAQIADQGIIQFASQLPDMPDLRRQPFLLALHDLHAAAPNEALHQRILTAFELDADRRLSLYRTMTRIGPLLGLMGTLIPLGPALVGLASGDISLLARKMEVAFATTVVGLVIGAIGYLLHQTAQRWALDDLSLLELASAAWLDAGDAAPSVPDSARHAAAQAMVGQRQAMSKGAPA